MKGEYDCNTLHPPHTTWELRAVSLMLWRWLSWGMMQILPQALSKRVECIFQQKTLPSPSENKHTYIYTHIHNYQKQNQTLKLLRLHIYQSKGRRQNLQTYTSLNWKWIFAISYLKIKKKTHAFFALSVAPLIEYFLYQNSIQNLRLKKVFGAQA